MRWGLTIIVGHGEEAELERLMKSIQGPLFDEVWITIATPDPSNEPTLRSVAERYATRVLEFTWCNDFAAARNLGWLKMLKDDTITHRVWLDADDVIKPSEYEKLIALKERLDANTVVLLDYVYSHDEHDRPLLTLPRERIFPNVDGFRWHDRIHEYINLEWEAPDGYAR